MLPVEEEELGAAEAFVRHCYTGRLEEGVRISVQELLCVYRLADRMQVCQSMCFPGWQCPGLLAGQCVFHLTYHAGTGVKLLCVNCPGRRYAWAHHRREPLTGHSASLTVMQHHWPNGHATLKGGATAIPAEVCHIAKQLRAAPLQAASCIESCLEALCHRCAESGPSPSRMSAPS